MEKTDSSLAEETEIPAGRKHISNGRYDFEYGDVALRL